MWISDSTASGVAEVVSLARTRARCVSIVITVKHLSPRVPDFEGTRLVTASSAVFVASN